MFTPYSRCRVPHPRAFFAQGWDSTEVSTPGTSLPPLVRLSRHPSLTRSQLADIPLKLSS